MQNDYGYSSSQRPGAAPQLWQIWRSSPLLQFVLRFCSLYFLAIQKILIFALAFFKFPVQSIFSVGQALNSVVVWLKKIFNSDKEEDELKLAAKRNSRGLPQVDSVFALLDTFIPSRIMNEQAGDTREMLERLARENAPLRVIYASLFSAVFWIFLAALQELLTIKRRKPN